MIRADYSNDGSDISSIPGSFEDAIGACGFGTFNILLLLTSALVFAAIINETVNMAYAMTVAECFLHLTLSNKSELSVAVYAGLILSALPWAFIADTFGRKPVLVYGLLLECFFTMCCALSPTFRMVIICKFLSAMCGCGPFAVLMSYVSEFHARNHRASVMMTTGICLASASILLPVLGIFVLPFRIRIHIGHMIYSQWQLFIAITGIPSLLGGFFMIFFPESPKFLMSQGRNTEALEVFKRVYNMNTNEDRKTFPYSQLLVESRENRTRQRSRQVIRQEFETVPLKIKIKFARDSFMHGVRQLIPMFSRRFAGLAIMTLTLQFSLMLGVNCLRHWSPQIFASLSEMESAGKESPNLCSALEFQVNRTDVIATIHAEDCESNIQFSTYIYFIILGSTSLIGSCIATMLVTILGNNLILTVCLFCAGCSASALYASKTYKEVVYLTSVCLTFTSIANTAVYGGTVNLFPTSMRTMIVMLTMTCGRVGTIIGNSLIPYLIRQGCFPPMVMISASFFVASILSLFLPFSTNVALK